MAQYKKEEVRKAILAAATRLFTQRGYDNTLIKDIAREAKISVGNIYRYFANKQEILYSLVTPDLVESLRDLLIHRTHILHKKQLKVPLTAEEDNWYENEYFDFLIANKSWMNLLYLCRKDTKYEDTVEEIVAEMVRVKLQLLNQVRPIHIPNELIEALNLIIIKTVELKAEVLLKDAQPGEMKKLMKIVDYFYQTGTAALWNKMLEGQLLLLVHSGPK